MKCCVCGNSLSTPPDTLRREGPLCDGCGSNARFRGVVLAILRYVFKNEESPLIGQLALPSVRAIGMSDSGAYAGLLATKLNYENTYLHQEPYLDVCDARSVAQYKGCDLLISSDVIEHTREPPHIVLRSMRDILSRNGIIVLSTPTYDLHDSLEWYPNAQHLEVIRDNDRYVVKWQNQRGVTYIDYKPNFHGGPGDTLEMRISTHEDLLFAAWRAGFTAETLAFDPKVGYLWPLAPTGDPVVPGAADGRILVLRQR